MRSELHNFGNIPVTVHQLATAFPNIAAPLQKMSALERDGRIIRLKKGLYVVSRKENELPLSKELIANHIYAPSYVSMLSALRFYGLIPETVYETQSMTVKASRSFDNSIGRFSYTHISRDVFGIGVTIHVAKHFAFSIATPEKALCDLISNTSGLNLRYKKDVSCFLEDDLRFEMDALTDFNLDILHAYAAVGKKSGSVKTLIKYLQQ